MNKLYVLIRKYRELVLISVDLFLVLISYILAFYIRTDLGRLGYDLIFDGLFNYMFWPLLLNGLAFLLFHLNRSLWTYISIDEVIRVALSTCVGNGAWFCIVVLCNFSHYIRSVPIIALILQVLLMVGVRITYRLIRRSMRLQQRQYRAVILGAGSAGVMALREIQASDRYDARVIGFIDRNPKKVKKVLNGISVLGTDNELAQIVKEYNIDTAYIAIKNITKNDLKKLIELCHSLKLRTKIVAFTLSDGTGKEVASVRNVKMDDLLGRGELYLNNEKIGSYLNDKVVMVTGAGGSIGSELVRQIIRFKPRKLVLLDIYENHMYELQQELIMKHKINPCDLHCLLASIRDKDRINKLFAEYKPNVVFHAAAHKHVPLVENAPLEAIKNNVFGTKNVIEACLLTEVEKFVFISTDKAVRTTNVMGATKRMCEMMIEGYKDNGITKLCAVRFGNVLGSSGSVIPLFERQIQNGGPVTVTDPNIIRYFMTIPEAAQLVLQAGAYANTGEIFILDMGKPVKILDLAKNLIELSGHIPNGDIKIKFTGLRPGEKLYEELLLDPKNCTKTDNNLIFIAKPEDISCALVEEKLAKLREALANGAITNKEIISLITSI